MNISKLQKLLLASTCALSIFAISTFIYENSGGSSSRSLKAGIPEELNFLPDDARFQKFLEQLQNYLNCSDSQKSKLSDLKLERDKPEKEPLYIITPTYPRHLQIPELTRLGQTLKHVENLIWIIAEDAAKPTPQVLELLNDLGIYYQYLLTPMPQKYKELKESAWPKGVENRNKGVEWILDHVKQTGDDSGVFYFADDDNTYDVRIFEEMRKTKRVSLFPVGFVALMPVSSAVLDQRGSLVEFYEGWIAGRKFPVDMAGFAVNVKHFVKVNAKKEARMDYKRGYEEDSFLKMLQVEPKDVEFLADNCSKIYVWHTKTQNPVLTSYKTIDSNKLATTNLGKLEKYWCSFLDDKSCNPAEVLSQSQLSNSSISKT